MERSPRSLDHLVVAIDGTAGAGKSTTSRRVARQLGLRYLDTGAMYRAVTLQLLRDGVDVDDPAAVATRTAAVSVAVGTDPETSSVELAGVDVSAEIRTDPVTAAVSAVSAVSEVRRRLVAQQRRLIGSGGIVVEGRDIGSVVWPQAELKVFLTAQPGARASRRAAELGAAEDPRLVETDLARRDALDSGRVVSPLVVAPDALTIDTTLLTLDEVVARVVGLVLERAGAARA